MLIGRAVAGLSIPKYPGELTDVVLPWGKLSSKFSAENLRPI